MEWAEEWHMDKPADRLKPVTQAKNRLKPGFSLSVCSRCRFFGRNDWRPYLAPVTTHPPKSRGDALLPHRTGLPSTFAISSKYDLPFLFSATTSRALGIIFREVDPAPLTFETPVIHHVNPVPCFGVKLRLIRANCTKTPGRPTTTVTPQCAA